MCWQRWWCSYPCGGSTGFITRWPWSFLNSDYYISLKARYMPVDYKEVAGVSDGWNRIYIGAPVVGGMVALPVQLAFVSLGDKLYFRNWVEQKQGESL